MAYNQWSISFLTSDGIVYVEGLLCDTWFAWPHFHTLKFPAAFRPTSKDLYEPATAISQFSSGPSHILALSDDGRIWSWDDESMPCYQIRFDNIGIALGPQDLLRPGTVTKVVAGSPPTDAGIVTISASIIPGTGSRLLRSRGYTEVAHSMGEVRNYVVLDKYIIFVKTNKAYAVQLETGTTAELPKFSAPGRIILDIQGAYRDFAIFTANGEVLLGNTTEIQQISLSPSLSEKTELDMQPSTPPSLQHTDVIVIAFGKSHFHALHANGRISAHGLHPKAYGALGLESTSLGAPFWSFKYTDHTLSSGLEKYPFVEKSSSPQYVWFEPEKKLWLGYLRQLSQADEGNAASWGKWLTFNSQGLLEQYSKWIQPLCIERQGEAWGDFPDVKEQDPDGLGSYFAVSIAAGGSQSVALVLVNEDLAKQIKDKHVLEYNSGTEPACDRRFKLLPDITQPIKYRFELGDFPAPHLSESGDIGPDRYDFSTWKYGFPQDNFQTPN
ncbi:hypothetical protein ACJ73_04566 [Blastomyces percursus]|uniref:Uncharacterized protein n=1 Tax=Blastomyces percursus TaxID=1658174 RepID=A0A1J9Q5S6_9EURO|nr:hypothetical protein ACJ73_04566 [Blastomyces percursus]